MRVIQRHWRVTLAIAVGVLASAAIAAGPAAADEEMECSPGAIVDNNEGCSEDGSGWTP